MRLRRIAASIALFSGLAGVACAEGDADDGVLRLPGAFSVASAGDASHLLPSEFSLGDFEALALASHPSLAELQSRVRAARCACYQAGLPPNPTVGYVASEIGDDGAAGQQGGYVGQRFIRGGKLGLDQAVLCQEVRRLEQELAAQRYRVSTEVRTAYYNAYLAQQQVVLTSRLVEVSSEAAESVQALFDAQEARRTDVLQAQIELQRIAARLYQAEFAQQGAWRRLAAAANQPGMPRRPLSADPAALRWTHPWEETRSALLAGSPEVAAAAIEIEKAAAAWRRACVEPTPDVTAQVAVQYDDATDDTITGVQIGLPLPLWNRNQGGIGAARHNIAAARRRLEALELRLTRQLAERLQQCQAAQARADAYRDGILASADENLQLVRQAYDAGEASYLDLLTVQRTYFESNLDYLAALREVSDSVQLLRGFLLGGQEG